MALNSLQITLRSFTVDCFISDAYKYMSILTVSLNSPNKLLTSKCNISVKHFFVFTKLMDRGAMVPA
jgi:hypothetical protein